MALTIVDTSRPVTGGVDTHLDVNVAAALDGIGGLLGVEQFPTSAGGQQGEHAGVEGVADPPFERPQSFLVPFAFGHHAVVVGAPVAVSMTDLGDGGHVDA